MEVSLKQTCSRRHAVEDAFIEYSLACVLIKFVFMFSISHKKYLHVTITDGMFVRLLVWL